MKSTPNIQYRGFEIKYNKRNRIFFVEINNNSFGSTSIDSTIKTIDVFLDSVKLNVECIFIGEDCKDIIFGSKVTLETIFDNNECVILDKNSKSYKLYNPKILALCNQKNEETIKKIKNNVEKIVKYKKDNIELLENIELVSNW
jgi:hypothetical protein